MAKAIYIVIFHKFDDIVRFGKIKMDVFHDLFKRCFKVVINAGRTSCPDFDFDLFVNNSGFSAELDDPKETWASSSNTPDGGNRFQFENKAADALIAQIRSEFDETKRNELYKKFQALIYEEQPAVFLFTAKERLALNKRFDATVTANPRRLYWLGEFKLAKIKD